jgi:hypothetical protein
MIRRTAFVHLRRDAPPDIVARLIDAAQRAGDELDVVAADAARTTPNSMNAGDVMLLGAFVDEEGYERARRHAYVEQVLRPLLEQCARHVEVVRYAQGAVDLREAEINDAIHRTLLVRIEPTVGSELVGRFERELRSMPRYIDAIRNSSLSRVASVRGATGPRWTHVWEQEFATLDDLTGPYMAHAYHWSLVDTWFDPQSPRQIVDPVLIHAACALRRSVLRGASTCDERTDGR